jgi:hypothetical protein
MTDIRGWLLAIALLGGCAPDAAATGLQEGLNAYRGNHIVEAEAALTAVAADLAAVAADRAEAQRELGRIDWLVRGETDGAALALSQAPTGRDACAAADLAQRVFREAGQPSAILQTASATLGGCPANEGNRLRVELARSLLMIAGASPDARLASLDEAALLLDSIVGFSRQMPGAITARFSLALARRDSAAAFSAWRDYFALTDADAPQAMSAYSGRARALFDAGLALNAQDADVIALLGMITRAGFVADAELFATETRVGDRAVEDPSWRRIAALFRFEASVRGASLRANRDMAGGGHGRGYEREVRAAMRELARASGLSGDPQAALTQAFGIYGTVGETSGYASLHAGYLVQDERVSVEQYGRAGELRFIAVDNMIANGFESWLWDGWAETGGWAPGDDTIVQVRSSYIGGPIDFLASARPGAARDARLADIARAEPGERAALVANSGVASLPATGERLQAIDAIAAHVGADDTTFVAEAWRATLQHSIYIHEGRHVLDHASYRGLRSLDDAEQEYRAKLSELALADYPRLALSTISSTQVGGDTEHGRANARILAAYRDWMQSNAASIAGFDPAPPALSQLDKLSDAQIRAVARALDPDAR